MEIFKYNPIKSTMNSNKIAIKYFIERDILGKQVSRIKEIWTLPEIKKILKKQNEDGSWKSHSANKKKHPAQNYELLETFRYCNILINMYGFTKKHPSIEKAAEYLFSCQTDEGDIRGIIGEQYAPYYNGIIVSFLNQAGYENDSRLDKIIKWLLEMRQADGGWVIGSPGLMGNYSRDEMFSFTTQYVGTIKDFDKSKPFSHTGTGMVIRAFATHSKYKNTKEAHLAAKLLISHFFKKDNYSSYQHPDNWVRFKFPFWWTDLISAMDSVSLIEISKENTKIQAALEWFIQNQEKNGLWKPSYSKIHKNTQNSKSQELQLWISYAILRIFKRYYSNHFK